MSQEIIWAQMTILRRLAVEKTGEDEATWARFFELYYPTPCRGAISNYSASRSLPVYPVHAVSRPFI